MAEWRTVNLTIGDAFANGHKMAEDVQIRVNVSAEEIQAAYEAGSNKIGVDIINTVAVGFKDNLLPREIEEGLRKHVGRLYLRADRVHGRIEITSKVWVRIFMYVVKLGNPDIRFKTLEYPTLVIGGYGIFDPDLNPAEKQAQDDVPAEEIWMADGNIPY
jgi:hypothetical protein